MFDVLVSVSVVVDDLNPAIERVTNRLGIPSPRSSWRAPAPGLEAMFCRVHHSMAISPTRFELIAAAPDTVGSSPLRFYVPEIVAAQGDRPIKAHATALATSNQAEVIERLAALGVRYRVDDTGPGYWPLVWLGVTPDEPASYDPSADGGLMAEVVATESLRLPPEAFAGEPGVPDYVTPGAMLRVAAKGILVPDLDAAIRTLDRLFGWQPQGPVIDVPSEGYRYVRMPFNVPQSATVELLQPIGDGPPGDFMSRWGPGPYHTRITVNGLAAKAADLQERGTPFAEVPKVNGLPGALLRVFEPKIVGALIEFVEHDEYIASASATRF